MRRTSPCNLWLSTAAKSLRLTEELEPEKPRSKQPISQFREADRAEEDEKTL